MSRTAKASGKFHLHLTNRDMWNFNADGLTFGYIEGIGEIVIHNSSNYDVVKRD